MTIIAETEFSEQLPLLLDAFGLSAELSITKLTSGHINNTFVLLSADVPVWVLQRINTLVFPKPEAIAHNWKLARNHIQRVDPQYDMLQFLPSANGNDYVITSDGSYWRLIPYVNNSYCITQASNATSAREAARAFGRFDALMATAKVNEYAVILKDFHNVTFRQKQLRQSLKKAEAIRLKQAKPLLERLNKFNWIGTVFETLQKKLPIRVVHMDAKISNVLFDSNHKALNIIDFDTLMPGTLLSDAGDLVRSMACNAAEDEINPDKIIVRADLVEAALGGYQQEVAPIASPIEMSYLSFGALMLLYMQAMRFLTDFLQHDIYYHIAYPDQNFRRSFSQLHILEQLSIMPAFSGYVP